MNKRLLDIQRLLAAAQWTNKQRIQLLLEQATLLRAAQNSEAAITSYDQALTMKPDDDDIRFKRAVALGDLGRWQEALNSYDAMLQLHPDNDPMMIHPGTQAFELKRYDPDDDGAWNNRGFALTNLGRWEEAVVSFDQALQLNPHYQLAWFNRSNALFGLASKLQQQGHLEEAATKLSEGLPDCNRALQLKPDDDLAWSNRGWALGNLKQYAEAISSHEKALQLRREKGDRKGELASLKALMALYSQSRKVPEYWTTANQAHQLAYDLDVPIDQTLYPNFVKQLMKFAQHGKRHRVLAVIAGILYLPVLMIRSMPAMIRLLLDWLRSNRRR